MKAIGITALSLALVCLALFTGLLVAKQIQASTYVVLLLLLSGSCLGLYLSPRLKEIKMSLKEAKLVLNKVEEIKKEIYAKEADLKRASLLFCKMIVFAGENANRAQDDDTANIQRKWIAAQSKNLLKSFDANTNEINEVFKFSEKYRMLDSHFTKKDYEKAKAVMNEIERMMEAECVPEN